MNNLRFRNPRQTKQAATSFKVLTHHHSPLEIYGDSGSMLIPGLHYFNDKVQDADVGFEWHRAETNRKYSDGNHRGIGHADKARAFRQDHPYRTRGALAFHILEVME